MKILVTGGAGFIGSHLADELIRKGHHVRIYDNLEPQVHGKRKKLPNYLNKDAEFINADVLDREKFYKAVKDTDILFHLAARVGVGQSMYQIAEYIKANTLGAGVILDIIANKRHRLKKIIVASSMSIYGEGKYKCKKCGNIFPDLRSQKQLMQKIWEMQCPICSRHAKPVPTDEAKPLCPNSVYAITKRDHEELFMAIGKAYKIPTVSLRYFNVYGPRQALSNPHTGLCAIFSARILNDHNPIVFEDGLQMRDFIHVKDIVAANMLAMAKKEADYQIFNVGTGRGISILKIAEIIIEKLKSTEAVKPQIKNSFRKGDIRHCFSDISKIRKMLGFKPQIEFKEGIDDLTQWVKEQACEDRIIKAMSELEKRGLA